MIQTINDVRVAEKQPKIPVGFLRPLWEIGFTELHQVASRNGTTLLT